MMRRYLSSPDWWIKTFAIMAVVGFATFGVGKITGVPLIQWTGAALVVPLLVGGIVALLALPVALWLRSKEKRK